MVVMANIVFEMYFYEVSADELSADRHYLSPEMKCSDLIKMLSINESDCIVKFFES